MRLQLYRYEKVWNAPFDTTLDSTRTLLLTFGEMGRNETIDRALKEICEAFPQAIHVGCSGAGEIYDNEVLEHSLVAAVVQFEKSTIRSTIRSIERAEDSRRIGMEIAKDLEAPDLKGILVISEGLVINGSELTGGMNEVLPDSVIVTGGLAGDEDRFEKTYVLDEGCRPQSGRVSAVGFYGESVGISSGFKGGWDRFGVDRIITESKKNVLYSLNGEPALAVYKRYLGKHAADLPASALFFPLAVRESKDDNKLKVRTVLAVDEENQSITFAGDIPQGGYAAFMRANFDRLIDGAYEAAEESARTIDGKGPLLSIAISCVGRKLVLKYRTEEELEAVLDALPEGTRQIGFYSYGEISTMHKGECDLHNQTMTLTLLWER